MLILDDSPFDYELMVDKLEEVFKIDVAYASNQNEFENALTAKGPYDVILSDYSLPSYDALQALKFAKEKFPAIPFICVSGTIGEEKAVALLKMGATDYVLKDRLTRLVPSVQRALKETKEQKELAEAQTNLRKQN